MLELMGRIVRGLARPGNANPSGRVRPFTFRSLPALR